MRGFNRVIIAGNLARDPDVRRTVNKLAYARFSVAVNYRRKDASGEYKDSVDYIPVIAWGQTAENCEKYLKKGNGVLIEGRITTSTYEAKDGSGKRYNTEVVAENLQFIGGSGQSSGNAGNYGNNARPQSSMGGFMPSDGDFGKPIGEGGFDEGGAFQSNFSNTDSNVPEGASEADIPF